MRAAPFGRAAFGMISALKSKGGVDIRQRRSKSAESIEMKARSISGSYYLNNIMPLDILLVIITPNIDPTPYQ